VSDADDFAEFVAARSGALLRTAYLLTGSHQDAEDLVQTALVKVVPKWGRLREHEPYVRRVMVNESISRWRRGRWRETPTADVRDVTGAEPDLAGNVALRRALGELAPRQRAVIVLRYFDDLTEPATAEVLGIAVGTVKSHARDGLARLRELAPHLLTDADASVRVGRD
jgi:RNA polymerase sigma-70 factor (sigma-E family)